MNISLFFVSTEKTGGLFDLDGTLPLMGLQFLGLMFLLNFILYTPLLTIIYDRNQYINKNLASAANIVGQAEKLIQSYNDEIVITRKKSQQEISDLKSLHEEVLSLEAKSAQITLNNYSIESEKLVHQKANESLASLESELSFYCLQILTKIFASH